jgi:uncharacterized protein YndB with AHSA1/START domain
VPLQDVAPITASTEIDVPPAAVWALVSDLRNMRRWSPQNVKTLVRGEAGVGTKMININRRGLLFWPTQSMIVRFEPETEIAFRVKENWTVWSYRLEPTASGGTRLTGTREAPDGISDLSVGLTKRVLGGIDTFTRELQQGIEQTLAAIKRDAEKGR